MLPSAIQLSTWVPLLSVQELWHVAVDPTAVDSPKFLPDKVDRTRQECERFQLAALSTFPLQRQGHYLAPSEIHTNVGKETSVKPNTISAA